VVYVPIRDGHSMAVMVDAPNRRDVSVRETHTPEVNDEA
jgi:hypothetical protein